MVVVDLVQSSYNLHTYSYVVVAMVVVVGKTWIGGLDRSEVWPHSDRTRSLSLQRRERRERVCLFSPMKGGILHVSQAALF